MEFDGILMVARIFLKGFYGISMEFQWDFIGFNENLTAIYGDLWDYTWKLWGYNGDITKNSGI